MNVDQVRQAVVVALNPPSHVTIKMDDLRIELPCNPIYTPVVGDVVWVKSRGASAWVMDKVRPEGEESPARTVLSESERVVREKLAAGDLRAVGYSLPVVMAEYDRLGAELAQLRARVRSLQVENVELSCQLDSAENALAAATPTE
jgi:hypothetical protein